MTNILLFVVIAIGIGIRILPILDSFVELIQHYIGLQIQKIDKQMQKVAMEVQKEFGQAAPQIGFHIEEDDLDD